MKSKLKLCALLDCSSRDRDNRRTTWRVVNMTARMMKKTRATLQIKWTGSQKLTPKLREIGTTSKTKPNHVKHNQTSKELYLQGIITWHKLQRYSLKISSNKKLVAANKDLEGDGQM